MKFFCLLLRLLVLALPFAVVGVANAQDLLRISSPLPDTVVAPGQSLQIIINQRDGLSPLYFNDAIGLLPSPLFAAQNVLSLDPYVVAVTVRNDVKPGEYIVVGVGRRKGETVFVQTPGVILKVSGAGLASIGFASQSLRLRFPGETRTAVLEGADQFGKIIDIPRDVFDRVTWKVDDGGVATVKGIGVVTALAPGAARLSAQVDGLSAFININVANRSMRGDLNGDNVIDIGDVAILQAAFNTLTSVLGDPRDLNGDGKIDALDLRVLTTLCTRPRCAAQ